MGDTLTHFFLLTINGNLPQDCDSFHFIWGDLGTDLDLIWLNLFVGVPAV